MRELLGKKLGMTRIFDADGDAIPVTVIEAGPCIVVDKRRTKRNSEDKNSKNSERTGQYFQQIEERRNIFRSTRSI